MAFFQDTANVKIGVNARSHHNLSQHVITTQEISRLQVIFKREMVPGDKFTVNPSSFHRLAPLPAPTYGNMKNVTRAFFVPARILMNGFEQAITQTTLQTHEGPVSPYIPRFTNKAFYEMIIEPSYGYCEETAGEHDAFDFKTSNSPVKYYRFSYKGKLLVNLMYSLGYRFNWTAIDSRPMSLLPLLAYGRLYLDWYMPTQYQPTDPLNAFFQNPQLNITSGSDLQNILSNIRFFEMLEKDFFTCAWPSPNGPVGLKNLNIDNARFGKGSDLKSVQVSNDKNSFWPTGDVRIISSGNGITSLSQYGLNTLKAVQDFVNRDMIAGNRYIEQMFARYGVKVPDSWLRRAEYLGSKTEPIQISDVMATDYMALGSYAGKGISFNQSSFSYEAKEFGYFIVINCIIAETGYYQGIDKENLHLDPFDFFTPEFDQLGAAPISNGELFLGYESDAEYMNGQSYGGHPRAVFGFAEQYYEYKNSRDYLLGDFAIKSRNTQLDAFHLFRHFPPPSSQNPLALNLNFMNGDPYQASNDFNRIFTSGSQWHDHFYSEHMVHVSASRPMHGSADSLVTEGGREVEMSFNGYQL